LDDFDFAAIPGGAIAMIAIAAVTNATQPAAR
jgi:uncharacterized membrane protein AbrB (regulator of aidB expression)